MLDAMTICGLRWALAFLGLGLTVSLNAQSVTSSVSGVVLDPSDATVSAAEIELRDLDTGALFRAATGDAGLFRIPGLRPGRYAATVKKAGFQPYRIEQLELLASADLNRTFRLQVAGNAEDVTVVARVTDIESAADSGVRGAVFSRTETNDLPMIAAGVGRNFRVQAFQQPGIASQGSAHAPFNVNGNRSFGTMNVMVDAAEFNNTLSGALLGAGIPEQPVSMETVEGLEMQTTNFKAEYGRASGTIINLITKRGTNQWRGSLYNYWQNARFNGRNAMLLERPPLNSNAPGFTIGGPVWKNRTFFYGGFEMAIRNTSQASSTIVTLSDDQRARAVEWIRPLAALFPRPNLGTNLQSATVQQSLTGRQILGKLDHILNDSHRAGFRYSKTEQAGFNPGRLAPQSFDSNNGSASAVLNFDSTLSPRALNEFKATYTTYDSIVSPSVLELGNPAANGTIGSLVVTGLNAIAGPFRFPRTIRTHNYNLSDDFSYSRGRHNLKFGGIFRWLQGNTTEDRNFFGQIVFANIDSFLAGRPLNYTRSSGDSRLDLRGRELGFYAQDDFKITRNLTLNLGLRYEYYSVFNDRFDRLPALYNGDRNNFAPRFGFAYNVGGKGATVVRGGYGIFYNPLLMNFVNETRFAPPLVSSFVRALPVFPNFLDGATLQSNRTLVFPSIVNPYVQSWNLTVERQAFTPSAVVSLGYVGSKGGNLARTRRPNGGEQLPQALRPNPNQGVIDLLETSASSIYHSLQASFRAQLSGGLLVRANYTWAKAIDDTSTASGFLPIDERNLRLDRGAADFDQRHLFTASSVYPLPWLKANRWLGGWQVAGTYTLRSALPFSILSNTFNPAGTQNNRVNALPGTVLRETTGSQFLRLAPGVTPASLAPAAGLAGTLGRNTERGDGFFDLSLSLQKTFQVTERVRAEARVESFNTLNQVNFAVPVNNVVNPLFGRSLTAQDPRSLQIAVRVTF